jgi:hypothetical protein
MRPVAALAWIVTLCATAFAAGGCGGGGGLAMALDPPTPYAQPVNIYAANTSTSTLTYYRARFGGDVVPRNVIGSGETTGVFGPTFIFLDVAGDLWCSNAQAGNVNVSSYDPNALPSTPPLVRIAGQKTKLSQPEGLAVDSAGALHVADGIGNDILTYAAGAAGNAKPASSIKGSLTGLNSPTGLALDLAGDVYVANGGGQFGGSVAEFAAGASGDVAPTRIIQGLDTKLINPRGIALDGQGQIFVATSSSVLEFAADSANDSPPLAVISGSNTLLSQAGQLSLDGGDNIFVASGGKNALLEFTAGSIGNAAPGSIITGSATLLGSPTGLAIR